MLVSSRLRGVTRQLSTYQYATWLCLQSQFWPALVLTLMLWTIVG